MIDRFNRFIEENGLFDKSDRLLLAISGGMDSMALLELCHRSGFDFGVIHCNFMLRGKEADGDEAFVKEAADRYGAPFYRRSFDTRGYAAEAGISIQMAARELRYGYFLEVAEKEQYKYIATAHHLDDQAETFFINLLRGCGIAGLHGIKAATGVYVRPLMFAGRDDIAGFIRQNELSYREDHTNSETKYTRNKIRHELIPVFREMNPAFQEEIHHTIRRISGAEKVYRAAIDQYRKTILTEKEGMYHLSIDGLLNTADPSTVLYEIIKGFGFNESDTGNILRAAGTHPGKCFMSRSHELVIDRGVMLVRATTAEGHAVYPCPIGEHDEVFAGPPLMRMDSFSAEGYVIPREKNVASLDLDKLIFPLQIRKWQAGDHFIPLGMNNKKKISDLLIDEKYSRFQKDNTLVVCSGNDIVWVVGERLSEKYKVTAATVRVYRITLEEGHSASF